MTIKDKDLEMIAGGSVNDAIIKSVMKLSAQYNLDIKPDYVALLISKGGAVLREYVKSKLPEDAKSLANIIPIF